MKHLGYGDAAVIFLVSRVGTSEEARRFVQGLGEDAAVGSTVYVSPSDLAAKRAVYEKSGPDNAYTVLVRVMTAVQLSMVLCVCANDVLFFS